MTGTTRSSAGLTVRRRKALFRAWRRGMREADLLLGSFADAEVAGLGEAELEQFESLLTRTDTDILNWIAGRSEIPGEHDTPLLRRVMAYGNPSS